MSKYQYFVSVVCTLSPRQDSGWHIAWYPTMSGAERRAIGGADWPARWDQSSNGTTCIPNVLARTIYEYLLRRPILSPGGAFLVRPPRRTTSTPRSALLARSPGGLSRMLKKSSSFVLASLRGSTYRSVRVRLFACCGLAGRPF